MKQPDSAGCFNPEYLVYCINMKVHKQRFSKHYFYSLLLLLTSIITALLLCEIILRYTLPRHYYIWPPHIKTTFKPYENIMPGISGQALFKTNSLGLRGDELMPDHTYRILAIGGSTTECLYLDQEDAWPYLLQKKLNETMPGQNIWVGNAGMSGKTTRHHLAAMYFLPLEEMNIDAVILLVGVNDLTVMLSRNELYDSNFVPDHNSLENMVPETFIGGNHPNPDDPIYKQTGIWLLLRKIKRIATRENVQDEAGYIYTTWREHRRNATEIIDTMPDLSSALKEYKRNIHKLIDIAQEKSVRLIVMTQPTMWRSGLPQDLEDLLWLGGIGEFQKESGKPYYSVEALENGMEAYNDSLLQVCRERHIECLDLASILKKNTSVFYDDAHFNNSGARKVADVLSEYIKNQ